MFDLSKIIVFGSSIASGLGGAALSLPVAEAGTTGSQMGWNAMTLAICGTLLAVVGMIMSFMDRRKVADADTNLQIIENHEKTIAFLEKQIELLRVDNAKTRERSHEMQDKAHAALLSKETELATLRAYMEGSGIEVPIFPNQTERAPIFPNSKTQPIAIDEIRNPAQ